MKTVGPAEDTFVPLPLWAVSGERGIGRAFGCQALAVYVALLYFRQRFTTAAGLRGREARKSKAAQTFYVPMRTIAEAAGVSPSTAHRALEHLQAARLVEVVERGGRGAANTYLVHDSPTGRVTQKQGTVSVTAPMRHRETRYCQADTPVRSEMRSETKEENGDGSADSPSFFSDWRQEQRAKTASLPCCRVSRLGERVERESGSPSRRSPLPSQPA